MRTDFHVRVRRVLEQVAAQGPQFRTASLRSACGGDAALLREVLSLLPHYQQMSDFDPPRPRGPGWGLPGTTTLLRVRHAVERGVPPPEPRPPFSLDQYTVVELLGSGGAGVVYRAVQAAHGWPVAIKLLRRGAFTKRDRWRFNLETEIVRQLRHPGIARFRHSGLARLRASDGVPGAFEERPYFVMEYVPGQPVTTYAARRALSAAERLRLLADVADAVSFAHARGIVHCDLKPDNILVNDQGQPKVLDFGIARLALDPGFMCRAPGCGGTLPYASPEQLAGRVDDITPMTDVYALGLLLHELFAGRLPQREGWAVRVDLSAARWRPQAPPGAPINTQFRYALAKLVSRALRQAPDPLLDAGQFAAQIMQLAASYVRPSRWDRLRTWLAGATKRTDNAAVTRALRTVIPARIAERVRRREAV